MRSHTPVQAVLLDPHPIWLDAIEIVLKRVGVEIVGRTTSGNEAVKLLDELRPRLLTLEIDPLPGEPDGFSVLRQARSSAENLRAIVLSRNHETRYIDAALAAGASAYIVKTAHPDDVASAVRQAFDHSVFLPGVPEGVGYEAIFGTLSRPSREGKRGAREFVFSDGTGSIERIRMDMSAHPALLEALSTTADPEKARNRLARHRQEAAGSSVREQDVEEQYADVVEEIA